MSNNCLILDYIDSVLNKISSDYNIPITDLLKYKNSFNNQDNIKKDTANNICKARKQDGHRCTRRCKEDVSSDFCGKHIKNQKYGCIIDVTNSNFINTDVINYQDNQYLLDNYNIVYIEKGDKYEIIGKMMKNGKIGFLDDLIEKNIITVDQLHNFSSNVNSQNIATLLNKNNQ